MGKQGYPKAQEYVKNIMPRSGEHFGSSSLDNLVSISEHQIGGYTIPVAVLPKSTCKQVFRQTTAQTAALRAHCAPPGETLTIAILKSDGGNCAQNAQTQFSPAHFPPLRNPPPMALSERNSPQIFNTASFAFWGPLSARKLPGEQSLCFQDFPGGGAYLLHIPRGSLPHS